MISELHMAHRYIHYQRFVQLVKNEKTLLNSKTSEMHTNSR